MQKLFSIMAAAALGLGVIASDAGAASISFVATGPTSIVEGTSTTFNVVMNLDVPYLGATFQVDAVGLGIVSAQNNVTGTGLGQANFNLRTLAFGIFPGSVCAGTLNTTCTVAAPGAPSAGNMGGLSGATSNTGTFTLGSFTVVGTAVGAGSISARITQNWIDASYNVSNPTSNVLAITVTPIPEPATAALLGLGLVGLVMAGRRSRA